MNAMIDTEILPSQFTPETVDDFVGPARLIATRIQKMAAACMARNAPAAHLFLGNSGSGKTALAEFTLKAFEVNQWNLHEVFGSDLTVEEARDIAFSTRLTSLFEGYRAYHFSEVDKCTSEARARILEVVGEKKQPRMSVVVATSNLTVAEFDSLEKTPGARSRLTSRFQCWNVEGPTWQEAVPLLERWMSPAKAKQLAIASATGDNGKIGRLNMRALLKDAEAMILE